MPNEPMTDRPLIVQSDKTVLLEVDHEQAGAARAAIAPFAELERAPEHIHTYRITPLALWNARAAGHDAEQVVDALVSFSRYAVPQPLLVDIVDTMARYGRLQLVKSSGARPDARGAETPKINWPFLPLKWYAVALQLTVVSAPPLNEAFECLSEGRPRCLGGVQ